MCRICDALTSTLASVCMCFKTQARMRAVGIPKRGTTAQGEAQHLQNTCYAAHTCGDPS